MAHKSTTRGASKPHRTPTVATAWDEAASVSGCGSDESQLRAMHAWSGPDPESEDRTIYRLAHHNAGEAGKPGPANLEACHAAIRALNAGSSGVPDEDREAVYRHLAGHVRDAGLTPAELKGARPAGLEARGFGGFERRFYPLQKIEHRAGKSAGIRIIEGYAAVFDSPTVLWENDAERVVEEVDRRCFSDTIRTDDIRGLFNHNAEKILGRNVSGTMTLVEDVEGLWFEIEADERQTYTSDLLISLDRGDVDECSFGFQVLDDEITRTTGGGKDIIRRRLLRTKLFDVGPVTYGAYPQTSVTARDARSEARAARAAAARQAYLLAGVPAVDVLEARARIQAGAFAPHDVALVRRALADLAESAGPTPEERSHMAQRRLDLAAREMGS